MVRICLALAMVAILILPAGPAGAASPSGSPQLITAIAVGGSPTGIEVNSWDNLIYVTNPASNSVTLINGDTNKVAGAFSVPDAGAGPTAVGIDHRTGLAFVGAANLAKTYVFGALGVVPETLSMNAAVTGLTIAVDSVTQRSYVSQGSVGSVRAFQLNSLSSSQNVTIGGTIAGVGVDVNTHRAYVASAGVSAALAVPALSSGLVSVIDTTTNQVLIAIPVGSNPVGVAVNPVTNQIYVTNSGDGTVSVIDGASNTVTATISVGSNPQGIAVNHGANRIYVANKGSGTLSIIDGTTNAVVSSLTVGAGPIGVAVNSPTNRVYVANSGDGTVSAIKDLPPPPSVTTRTVATSCLGQPNPCYTSIQAAVNAGVAGDIINIQSGTYTENVNVTKSLTIQGASATSPPTINANGGASALYVTAWNVTIQGTQINGATAGDPASQYALKTAGIVVDFSARGVTIQNNAFSANRRGITAVGGNLTINHNTILNSAADGILLSQGQQQQHMYPSGKMLAIINNTITTTGGAGILSDYADFMSSVMITGNVISGTTAQAIEACCYANEGAVGSITLSNNQISDSLTSGELVNVRSWVNSIKNQTVGSITISGNTITNSVTTNSSDLLDACCIGESINGMTIGPIQITGNTVSGGGELDFCCPYESVNDNSGNELVNNTGPFTINPSSFGPITVSNNSLNSPRDLDVCCPFEGVGDLNVNGNTGTVMVGPTIAGDLTVDSNTVNGGGFLEICCPVETTSDGSLTNNSGSIAIGKFQMGKIHVTNNVVNGSTLDFCCPIEGVSDPIVSSQTGGSIVVGPTIVGNVTVANNTVNSSRASDGLEVCCWAEDVTAPELSTNTGGFIAFGGSILGTLTVNQNTVTGTNVYIDVCCPAESVVQTTVDSSNRAAISFAPSTTGAMIVSNNTLSSSNPQSTTDFDICCAVQTVDSITVASGAGGSLHVGTATVGAVTVSGNAITAAMLDASRIDLQNGPKAAEGGISITGNQVIGSNGDGIFLGSSSGYLGKGGQNTAVTVTGNTITNASAIAIDAPSVGSRGPIAISQNSVTNPTTSGILLGQAFGSGMTVSKNSINVSSSVGIDAEPISVGSSAVGNAPTPDGKQRRDSLKQRVAGLAHRVGGLSLRRSGSAGSPSTSALTIDGPSITGVGSPIVVTQNSVSIGSGALTSEDNTPAGTVTWYDPIALLGNYWSDYVSAQGGFDNDGDGIGEVPYNIAGSAVSQDLDPLMQPPVSH